MENKKIITDIVLIDIIDFSLLQSTQQLEVVEYMTKSYQKILNKLLEASNIQLDEFILGYISTGDGFYCLLEPDFKGFGTILGLNFNHLSQEISKKFPYFKGIRIAVHIGEVYQFIDILNNKNFIGSGLNECARYLSANEFKISTVMISQTAYTNFQRFVDNHPQYNELLMQREFKHSDIHIFTDKHGAEIKGYRVWLRKSGIITPPIRQ